MPVILIGITIILAKLFPFGGQLLTLSLGYMYGPFFGKLSPAWFHAATLLANYIPALVVAIIVARKTQLEQRLPKTIPGKGHILWGVGLLVLYLVPRLFASTIPGGGPAFVVGMFGPVFIIPADILVFVGVTKALLSGMQQPDSYPNESAR